MFNTSLRKGLIAAGLVLMLLAALGAVVVAAPTTQADEDGGVLIVSVRANSPADKAGLVDGDIVLAVDDEATKNAQALAAAITDNEMGDEVLLTVLHDGETVEMPVILGERNGRTYLGVQPDVEGEEESEVKEEAEVKEEDASGHEEPPAMEEFFKGLSPMDAVGAIVAEVVEGSPAAEAGLAQGDVIVAVDGEEVSPDADLGTLIGAFEPGDEVSLEVRSIVGDETVEVVVTLGTHPEDDDKAFLGISYMPASMMFNRFSQLPHGDEATPEQGDADKESADEEDVAKDSADEDDAADEETLKDAFSMPKIGAVITEIVEDGPAADAGLAQGDMIMEVDGEKLSPDSDLAALIGAFEPGDEVTLEVRSVDAKEGETVEVVVTLGAHPEDEGKAFLGIAYMPAPAMFGLFDRMPSLPRGVEPAPEQEENDAYRHHHRRGDKGEEYDCPHHQEGYDGHRGHDRHHGQDHGGMMMPFFEGFDLDQLSEEELKMLQEIMPFLFPDLETEPESEDGV